MVSVTTICHNWDSSNQGQLCAVGFQAWFGARSLPDALSSMPDFLGLSFGLIPFDCSCSSLPWWLTPFPDCICLYLLPVFYFGCLVPEVQFFPSVVFTCPWNYHSTFALWTVFCFYSERQCLDFCGSGLLLGSVSESHRSTDRFLSPQ